MKRTIRINGKPGEIEVLTPAPACRFRIDAGLVRSAEVAVIEPGVYFVLLDGRPYEARVEDGAILIDGHRIAVEVLDPREWRRGAAAGAGEGLQTVTSPMPGKVVRVLVAAGDEVRAGQGLIVVEAMKMQNELRALRDGRIVTVSAREGATVTAGEALATLE